MDDWVVELQRGRTDAGWDAFVGRYRRVIFAAIRHYAQDYDDVMDVFARVCEALREDDCRRLRAWADQREHSAKFTTWLVTVVRHLTVDWFRSQRGRRRLPRLVDDLPLVQRRIFELVFLDQRSHVETYELLRTRDAPDLSFHQYLTDLRATYRAVTQGRRGHVLRDFAPPPPEPAASEDVDAGDAPDRRELLTRLLATLSPEDRVAVQLYVVDEVPAEAAARVLGYPNAKAVYNRVYRALAALREQLERAGLHREDL